MVTLANSFVDRGKAVDLILVRAEGPYMEDIHPAVRVVDLHASSASKSIYGFIRYLRRERPSAVLSTLDHINLVALSARILSRIPVRIVIRIPNTLSVVAASSQRFKDKIVGWLARMLYIRADAIIAVSHGVAKDLLRATSCASSQVVVISNPTVTPELYIKAKEPLDHPWLEPNQPPVLLAVGRLVPQKDHATLIRALAVIRRRQVARLMILGEGDERGNLKRLIEELSLDEDVELTGFVRNPYPYMARASAFILSSRWEGLPNVLIEALAIGCLVVSTDCPSGPREILHGGAYGRLVSIGDVEGLAAAIIDALESSMPQIPKDALAPYGIQCVADQYLKVLLPSS